MDIQLLLKPHIVSPQGSTQRKSHNSLTQGCQVFYGTLRLEISAGR